jgi:hypothetical protein
MTFFDCEKNPFAGGAFFNEVAGPHTSFLLFYSIQKPKPTWCSHRIKECVALTGRCGKCLRVHKYTVSKLLGRAGKGTRG